MYSYHPLYEHFKHMIQRGREVGCDFNFGIEEFNRWLDVIGPIPEGMNRPTVGRYDHSKGYVFDLERNRWNFRWQEKSENNSESGTRGGARVNELGLSGFKTGAAQRASVASLNNNRNTKRSGWHTGAGARASVSSPGHNTKQSYTCSRCSKSGIGPRMINHVNNGTVKCPL